MSSIKTNKTTRVDTHARDTGADAGELRGDDWGHVNAVDARISADIGKGNGKVPRGDGSMKSRHLLTCLGRTLTNPNHEREEYYRDKV